jgi:NAD(P)-dependent dehydrogenase (short-subunit alcohol dehydrogenase family)
VVVASKAHRHATGLNYATLRSKTESVGGLKEYAAAKLANILFASELGRRLQGCGVTTYSLHPGVVATDVWRSLPWPLDWVIKQFMLTAEQGAATTLYCATSPDCASSTGLYYENSAQRRPSKAACDMDEAKRLWDSSEKWIEKPIEL